MSHPEQAKFSSYLDFYDPVLQTKTVQNQKIMSKKCYYLP